MKKKKLGGHFKKKLIENELHISCFIWLFLESIAKSINITQTFC